MASAPSRKPRSYRLREDMALMFGEEIRDTQRFFSEYEKNGPGFLVAEVSDRKMFKESFDRLLRKGCRPSVLFLSLHHLLNFELREKSCQYPGKRELRSLETSLRKTVEDIRTFEKKYAEAHRIRVQSHSNSLRGPGEYEFELYMNRMKSLSRAGAVIDSMSSYAEMLRSWWTPRSDVLKSYGSIHTCLYAQLATGKPQISTIAKLHSSFIGRYIEPAALRKHLSRFKLRYENLCTQINGVLYVKHTLVASVDCVDWSKVFGPNKDKSK